LRLTAAKVRTIGAAEGTIIATIITAHMRKSGTSCAGDQACTSGPDIFMPAQAQTPVSIMARASPIM